MNYWLLVFWGCVVFIAIWEAFRRPTDTKPNPLDEPDGIRNVGIDEMALGKKHYELIASAFASTKPEITHSAFSGSDCQWIEDIQAVASVLEQDNPRFDSQRFIKACYRDGKAKPKPEDGWMCHECGETLIETNDIGFCVCIRCGKKNQIPEIVAGEPQHRVIKAKRKGD